MLERQLSVARPDCVLLDMNLPDATGLDALDRITHRDATLPIVVLTGLTDEHFGISAVGAGAQDYLVKGRVEADMLQRAAAVCHRAQARRTHGRRTARQPTSGTRERPPRTRAAAVSPAARRPRCRDRRPLPAEPRERPARWRLLRLRPDRRPHRPRHDRRRRRARARRGGTRCRAAHRLARTDLRRASAAPIGCVS